MFFFIGGVQPKTRILEQKSQRCPRCGADQVVLQRVDHYLSLFFIPLLPVKKGEPFLFCRQCGLPIDGFRGFDAPRVCLQCGRQVEPDHRYCPYCGRPR